MVLNYLYHQRNIETKIETDYGRRGADFAQFKRDYYDPYRDAQLAISGIDRDSILQKIRLLADYYSQVQTFNTSEWIKPQSKFRPTILEEFCGFLFKDIPKISELDLGFYNKKIFAGMAIKSDGTAEIKTKDIDFCIGKHFDVIIGDISQDVIIPIIAIECKTYTDKTMLNEAQFAAQKLKQGSCNTKVYILSEGNQVDDNEIPLKGQTPLDQIFILRKLKDRRLWRNPKRKEWDEINGEAIIDFFTQITFDLDTLLTEKRIPPFGKIMLG